MKTKICQKLEEFNWISKNTVFLKENTYIKATWKFSWMKILWILYFRCLFWIALHQIKILRKFQCWASKPFQHFLSPHMYLFCPGLINIALLEFHMIVTWICWLGHHIQLKTFGITICFLWFHINSFDTIKWCNYIYCKNM